MFIGRGGQIVSRIYRDFSKRFVTGNGIQIIQQYPLLMRQVGFYGTDSNIKNEGEVKLIQKLKTAFPTAKEVIVEDISGGCGSMYQIYVESSDFKGMSTVKQHQMINKALKEEIKEMHGLRIVSKIPS